MNYKEAEPLLDDARVARIAERIFLELPALPDETSFATFHDGTKFQFFLSAPNPRPIQRKYGVQHGLTADGDLAGWREAEAERRHFVAAKEDPAYPIFRALAHMMIRDMRNFKSMTN